MENIALVRKFLGGTRVIGAPKTELDFVPIIRKGFPISVYTALRNRTQLGEDAICESLNIAKRTAARRKKQAVRLKSDESERFLRLARVLAAATDVLGSEDKARTWLVAENRALGGTQPIKLLDTGIGFQEVMDVLKRVEYGDFS